MLSYPFPFRVMCAATRVSPRVMIFARRRETVSVSATISCRQKVVLDAVEDEQAPYGRIDAVILLEAGRYSFLEDSV